jgi:hypothetical protein
MAAICQRNQQHALAVIERDGEWSVARTLNKWKRSTGIKEVADFPGRKICRQSSCPEMGR